LRAADAERGDTLIELMVTVAVLGIAMVAILSGLWGLLRAGEYNTKASAADLVLRDYAETLKANGQTTIGSTTYNATYIPCQTLGTTTGTYPAYTPQAPNANYTATITQIQFLNGYSGTTPVWKAQSLGCPTGGDQGLQMLTLRVSSPASSTTSSTETVNIIKRNTTGES
jgi:prepilin-type N-terminal cleavage/methylation domain-containing protein